uniref:Guanylyl cyclase n=1 Tax=Tetraselmis sp. GSL018 TaxID=582737 RepID=A0A061QVT6_9CHLO
MGGAVSGFRRNLTLSETPTASYCTSAGKIVPFVPERVLQAYLSGHLNHKWTGAINLAPPIREASAVTLLLDVSGFTALSEKFSEGGTKSFEEFSLLLSGFFARTCEIIFSYGGDIDCFAGDALLILFPSTIAVHKKRLDKLLLPRDSRNSSGGASVLNSNLIEPATRALQCAFAVSRELNEYEVSPGLPRLTIHAAMACGDIYSVECGGSQARRGEAFVLGRPLCELRKAVDLSRSSEIVLTAMACEVLQGHFCLRATEQREGHVVLELPRVNGQTGQNKKHFKAALKRRQELKEKIVSKGLQIDRMQQGSLKWSGRSFRRSLELFAKLDCSQAMGSRRASDALSEALAHASEESSALPGEAEAAGETERLSCKGLESLLSFVPSSVRESFVTGMEPDQLAEHRTVSILFVVSSFEGKKVDIELARLLQRVMGKVIDLAEVEFGGETRQVTVDEKGLAAIFAFGLPGFTQYSRELACIGLALEIVRYAQKQGLQFHAGLDSGSCFCGLMGHPELRCEYTILGDTVNTAARIAGKASASGTPLLCTGRFKTELKRNHSVSWLEVVAAGEVTLKGKAGSTPVFELRRCVRPRRSLQEKAAAPLVGRDRELRDLGRFVRDALGEPRDPIPPAPATVRLRARCSGKKLALAQHLLKRLLNADDHLERSYSEEEAGSTSEWISSVHPQTRRAVLGEMLEQEESLPDCPMAKLIATCLKLKPAVVLVDDVDNADPSSLSSIAQAARALNSFLEDGHGNSLADGQGGPLPMSVMILTARHGNMREYTGEMQPGDHHTPSSFFQDDDFATVRLPALEREAIAALAARTMRKPLPVADGALHDPHGPRRHHVARP